VSHAVESIEEVRSIKAGRLLEHEIRERKR
jgi:hypothetical protein